MRPDLGELGPGEQEISELRLLLARRRDLITDRSRTITRLRETLLSLFPALERALDLNGKGPLTLLTHYQSPAQLRRAGHKRVATYLRNRGVKGSANVARKALSAAESQSVILPAQEEVASRIVAELAEEVLAFKERIESIDEEIGQRFFARPEARILRVACRAWDRSSGPCFLVCVGDVSAFESADRLAAYAGLVPAARDSGKRVGNRRILGEEGTRPSKGSCSRQRLPVCVVQLSPESSTTARGPRAKGTSKP
jgi:transposase